MSHAPEETTPQLPAFAILVQNVQNRSGRGGKTYISRGGATIHRLRNHLIGVDRGQVLIFSDFADGGPMWTGEGPRSARRDVTFSEPYRQPPQVMVSLSMFDMDQASNQRADIAAEEISEIGFALVFRTWGDTRIARIRADWMSIGELYHPDDWDIESR